MSVDSKSLVEATKKRPLLVLCGLITVVLAAFVYLRSDLLDEQEAVLERYVKEGGRYRANVANSAQLQQQLDFLIQANKAIKDRSFNTDGVALNLQFFYKLESEVGVKYIDLRPGARPPAPVAGKPVVKTRYVPINYMVTAQGSYPQIISFLRHLERGGYFIRINTASVVSMNSVVTLNLSLDLLGIP